VHAWHWSTLALGVNALGNSPAFDCSRSVSVFVRRSPPNTPRASVRVATSGFTRLPLCFTRVWWTAEFGARELPLSQISSPKRCSLYMLFLVLSKGLNFFVSYSPLIKMRIGVMKWWLEELMICTHENFLYNTGNVNRSYQKPCYILYCDRNLCWCASSGVRVRLFEPAPRELKARKTPSKIKLK
jgi:hypothetical protein